MKNNIVYIKHILDSIERIRSYIEDFEYAKFLGDYKTSDAVVRNIEIIGEAATNCSEHFRNTYPGIPWRNMIDARNKMIHNYAGVMLDIVWGICQDDLPVLEKKLKDTFQEEL